MALQPPKKTAREKEKGDKPALSLRASGGLKTSCWQNEYEDDKGKTYATYSVLVARSYFDDKEKKYKDTNYLREQDLLPMAELLRSMWEAIRASKQTVNAADREAEGAANDSETRTHVKADGIPD
jgi:hypothetical protein